MLIKKITIKTYWTPFLCDSILQCNKIVFHKVGDGELIFYNNMELKIHGAVENELMLTIPKAVLHLILCCTWCDWKAHPYYKLFPDNQTV